MTLFQSKTVFLTAISRFAVQNDRTYLPRITRETCTWQSNILLFNNLSGLINSWLWMLYIFWLTSVSEYLKKYSFWMEYRRRSCTIRSCSIRSCTFRCELGYEGVMLHKNVTGLKHPTREVCFSKKRRKTRTKNVK